MPVCGVGLPGKVRAGFRSRAGIKFPIENNVATGSVVAFQVALDGNGRYVVVIIIAGYLTTLIKNAGNVFVPRIIIYAK